MIESSWAVSMLSDLIDDAIGGLWGSPPDSAKPDEADVIVVRGADFRNWEARRALDASPRRIPARSLERRRLLPGDLVLEVSGGSPAQPVGRTLVIDGLAVAQATSPLICSNFCRKLRLKPGVNPYFVKRQLDWLYHTGQTDHFQTSTTNIRNLQVDDFLSGTSIALPEEEMQARLTELLDQLDSKRTNSSKHVAAARRAIERFRQSVLAAACSGRLTADWRETNAGGASGSDVVDSLQLHLAEQTLVRRKPRVSNRTLAGGQGLPEPWTWAPVSDLALVLSGQTMKGVEDSVADRGDYPWFKVADMNTPGNERYMEVSKKWLTRFDAVNLRMRPLPSGSIIFPKRGGAIATNKKRILATESCVDLNLMAMVPAPGIADYLWWWFYSIDLGALADGSNVPQINHPDIEELLVPVPPSDEQEAIVQRVESLMGYSETFAHRIEAASGRIERSSQAILAKAFRGDLQ